MKAKYFSLFVFVLALINAAGAFAQDSSIGAADDCTQNSVNYADDSTLTNDEKIALMDKALLKSLNKYEGCQNADSNSSANSGGGGGGGDAGGGMSGTDGKSDGKSDGNSAESGSSTASSDMSGTEATADQKAPTPSLNNGSDSGTESGPDGGPGRATEGQLGANSSSPTGDMTQVKKGSGSGAAPQDIPPGDNDSALAGQIRYAAETETDPVKREKLWNEYRKYKGLPAVKAQN